jgi:hypothetical protein
MACKCPGAARSRPGAAISIGTCHPAESRATRASRRGDLRQRRGGVAAVARPLHPGDPGLLRSNPFRELGLRQPSPLPRRSDLVRELQARKLALEGGVQFAVCGKLRSDLLHQRLPLGHGLSLLLLQRSFPVAGEIEITLGRLLRLLHEGNLAHIIASSDALDRLRKPLPCCSF